MKTKAARRAIQRKLQAQLLRDKVAVTSMLLIPGKSGTYNFYGLAKAPISLTPTQWRLLFEIQPQLDRCLDYWSPKEKENP